MVLAFRCHASREAASGRFDGYGVRFRNAASQASLQSVFLIVLLLYRIKPIPRSSNPQLRCFSAPRNYDSRFSLPCIQRSCQWQVRWLWRPISEHSLASQLAVCVPHRTSFISYKTHNEKLESAASLLLRCFATMILAFRYGVRFRNAASQASLQSVFLIVLLLYDKKRNFVRSSLKSWPTRIRTLK